MFAVFGSCCSMFTVMPIGFSSDWMIVAIVAWSELPESISSVVVKPFGTLEAAISFLAWATLYCRPGVAFW